MFEKKILNLLLKNMRDGSLLVKYWDGETKKFGNKEANLTLEIKNPKVIKDMLTNMTLGFGEAYMHNLADTNNLPELMSLATKNSHIIKKHSLLTKLHKNTKSNQAKYIQQHYDIGNEFFKLWLDDSMTYSCAYFKTPKDSLELAQKQKRQQILKKLQLEKNMSLLDIGCGWGTLLIEAAKQLQVSGMGITLSKEQYKHAIEQAKKAGVENKITFALMNFHELFNKKMKFDRIVSVGMFEHVGKENYDTYFHLINDLLVDGGISVLHTISQQTEEANDSWIDKYIFPGGYLPSIREIVSYFPKYNLRMLDYENLRIHYALTLDAWTRRFLKHKKEVIAMYSEQFFRMWYFWLIGSTTGFRFGDLDLSQFIITKGINNNLPLTRENLYKNTSIPPSDSHD